VTTFRSKPIERKIECEKIKVKLQEVLIYLDMNYKSFYRIFGWILSFQSFLSFAFAKGSSFGAAT
jgi:hypothetical protein